MAKQKNYLPKPGKCDIIEGILIGNRQTNALNKKHQDDKMPENMINKLCAVARQTSCSKLKQQAEKAAELLQLLPADIPAKETDCHRILKETCNI